MLTVWRSAALSFALPNLDGTTTSDPPAPTRLLRQTCATPRQTSEGLASSVRHPSLRLQSFPSSASSAPAHCVVLARALNFTPGLPRHPGGGKPSVGKRARAMTPDISAPTCPWPKPRIRHDVVIGLGHVGFRPQSRRKTGPHSTFKATTTSSGPSTDSPSAEKIASK